MKQVRLLILLGLSLISMVTLPMRSGLGAMASRVMPRLQAAASKARTTAANVKAKAFPAFCRAVNVGISGAIPSVFLGGVAAGLHVLSAEGIRKYTADFHPAFKGGVKEVDDKLATLVRGSLNIPLFVGEGEEKEEQDLLNVLQQIKAGGLTYLAALRAVPLNCAALWGRIIVMSSGMHKLLSAPELFIDGDEYEKFCEWARAAIQHEGGHCLEQHTMQKAVWKIGAPIALHMATKRLGPIAKQLLKINPIAQTKKGMFVRAVGGGIAKDAATNIGLLVLSRNHEHRADSYIDDAHKKYIINFFYNGGGNQPLWHSKNPDFCSFFNLYSKILLDEHPHPARRTMRVCGSLEQAAKIIVKAEREEQKKPYEIRKAKMAALQTDEEKIEFLVNMGYSGDAMVLDEIRVPVFEHEYRLADDKINHCENDNAQEWLERKALVIKDMEDALSLTHNITGTVQEISKATANACMKRYARSIMEQEIKDVERLQKQLAEVTSDEDQVQFCKDEFWFDLELSRIQANGVEVQTTIPEKIAFVVDPSAANGIVSNMVRVREAMFKQNNPEAESQTLSQSFQAQMFPKYYAAFDELWQEREAAQAAQAKAASEAQQKAEDVKAEKEKAE